MVWRLSVWKDLDGQGFCLWHSVGVDGYGRIYPWLHVVRLTMSRSSHCLQATRVGIAYERAVCQVDHCKVVCTYTVESCIQSTRSLSLSSLDRS